MTTTADMTLSDRVKKVIIESLGVDADLVKPEARFKEELGADSLDQVEFVMALEEEFDITIPDDLAAETVGELTKQIETIRGH